MPHDRDGGWLNRRNLVQASCRWHMTDLEVSPRRVWTGL